MWEGQRFRGKRDGNTRGPERTVVQGGRTGSGVEGLSVETGDEGGVPILVAPGSFLMKTKTFGPRRKLSDSVLDNAAALGGGGSS